MRRFDFAAATDLASALGHMAAAGGETAGAAQTVQFIAGGTNLLDLMKEGIAHPAKLVDINALPLKTVEATPDGGLMLGALVSNADLAYHPQVLARYPLLSQAILAGASPQLRNMASTGGNLLQRTRCYYFYDAGVPCNKRVPGSGCPAREGLNRIHAILGASDACIAVHPSDMCVALAALRARVHVQSARGKRVIEFADFHRLPGATPELDTNLARDELILGVELAPDRLAPRSTYLKLRDRASYAFALVSVAAALELDQDGVIRDARLALGGVAHKPWRDAGAEALLLGQPASEAAFQAAAELALRGARGYGQNDFKITLARRAIVRALGMAATPSTEPERRA